MVARKIKQELAPGVEDVLANERRRSARMALKQFAYTDDSSKAGANGTTKAETPDAEASSNGVNGSLRKRKRDTAATAIKSEASVPSRTSPRKAETPADRKPRRQPAKRVKGPDGLITFEPPTNWEQVYDMTATMRKRVLAPVDTMGCETLHEVHREPREQRLQILISLMLSSQTKDTVTAAAIQNLQANLPGGLTLDALLAVEPDVLNGLIGKVGFHNLKTNYIKKTALILRDSHDSDIPDSIEGLVALPGVGPKMAYLCMSAAWGRDEGIGVDVHVHRITNLWGWHKTNTPEQTRMELEAWLPKEKWHEINHLLVGFGQTICLPVGRKCHECDLAEEMLCPARQVHRRSPVKKRVKTEVEVKVEGEEVEGVEVDKVVVERDDVGIKVEANLQEEGKVEIQALAGAEDEVKVEPKAD